MSVSDNIGKLLYIRYEVDGWKYRGVIIGVDLFDYWLLSSGWSDGMSFESHLFRKNLYLADRIMSDSELSEWSADKAPRRK